jgi:hypothetical protein
MTCFVLAGGGEDRGDDFDFFVYNRVSLFGVCGFFSCFFGFFT